MFCQILPHINACQMSPFLIDIVLYYVIKYIVQFCAVLFILYLKQMYFLKKKCNAVCSSGEEVGCEHGYHQLQGEFSTHTSGEEVRCAAGSLPAV